MTLKLAYAAPSRQLTDAPEIDSVDDLSLGWRKVCTMIDDGKEWHGDLVNRGPRAFYEALVVMGVAITVQYRVAEGHYRVFAKKKAKATMPRQPEGRTKPHAVLALMQNRSSRGE